MATETTKLLQALELDKNGNWDGAHKIVQGIDGKLAANIHAYLHRKQGDNFNADYWYRRAGISMPDLAPDSEWQELFDKLQLQVLSPQVPVYSEWQELFDKLQSIA